MKFLVNREGLSYLMDSVGDHYSALYPNTDLDKIYLDKNNLHDSGFVSPVNVTMPFAKLIPILSSLVKEISKTMKLEVKLFSRLTSTRMKKMCG